MKPISSIYDFKDTSSNINKLLFAATMSAVHIIQG